MVLRLVVWVLLYAEVGLAVLIVYLFVCCETVFCCVDLFARFRRPCGCCDIVAAWWRCWVIGLSICLGCCLMFV